MENVYYYRATWKTHNLVAYGHVSAKDASEAEDAVAGMTGAWYTESGEQFLSSLPGRVEILGRKKP